MISRVRLASLAFVLLVSSVTASFAQQSDSTTSVHPNGFRPHFGAVGGQLGIADIVAGGDYANGAMPRLCFNGSFRYVASPHWGWQVNPYYSWVGYKTGVSSPIMDPAYPTEITKDHYLTQVMGANAQVMRFFHHGGWLWHIGAGPAVYRVLLEDNRTIIKDPTTFARHRATYMGATAEIGAEHFLKSLSTTSLEWTAGWHAAFAKDDTNFPNGFSDTPQVFELRFGGHYYFDLSAPKKSPTKPGLK